MNVVIARAVACSLMLATTASMAQNGSGEVQWGISPGKPQAVSMKECQDKTAQFASHGFCGQGDLACVARLTNELKNSVEKTCLQAIHDLKPQPQRPPE
ncbi:hypothetical protein ACQKFX_21370 [Cupriavidus metallidurans]|uniref:hypothetical protein n=1 Tax=Cupriavidus metallidurans TaxID=119219 RepID=UPI003D07E246